MGIFALLGSLITLALWTMGSGRRLLLVKERIGRDWDEVRKHLEARKRLLFELGGEVEDGAREQLAAAHEGMTQAFEDLERKGGPLEARLGPLEEAEWELQRVLAGVTVNEELDRTNDRLTFALETYNDGVRLLRRLKRALFHWPIAMAVCPRRVDLFETGPLPEGHVVKIKFNS